MKIKSFIFVDDEEIEVSADVTKEYNKIFIENFWSSKPLETSAQTEQAHEKIIETFRYENL